MSHHLNDEDIERILQKYRKTKETPPQPKNIVPKDRKIKCFGKRFASKRKKRTKIHDRILIRLRDYVKVNKPNPYIFEYLMAYCKTMEGILGGLIIAIILPLAFYLIEGVFITEISLYILLVAVLCAGFLIVLPNLYAAFTSPVLKGLFRDKLSGYPLAAENMTIEDIFVCGTTDAFQKWEEDVPYIIDKFYPEEYEATPSVLFCRKLAEDTAPKSSTKKQCFRFYDDTPFRFDPKNCKHIFWIMTRQKSDLLDLLIELEPTAEFEITYLKHSKILKKIAPIPGWEYADGVTELCDEINQMYP